MTSNTHNRGGFTMMEVIIALSLSVMAGIGILSLLFYAAGNTRWGGFQVRYNMNARSANHRIARVIEEAKAVGVSTNSLTLMMIDMRMSRIVFDDGGDIGNLHNNQLRLIHDVSNPSHFTTLATQVTPIPGETMFGTIPTTPRTARIAFRLGDDAQGNARAYSRAPQPYHGVEVRVSATPRNLQRWYESP